MRLGYQTNTWGGVVGHPAGVTSIKDLFYLTNGNNEEALEDIHNAGYDGIEIFDGNVYQYVENPNEFKQLLDKCRLQLIAVYSGANFIYEDVLEDELWRVERAAELGQKLGAEHLVVGGGGVRAKGVQTADYARLARGLDRVIDIAKKYELRPSYHPHLGTIGQAPEQIDQIFAQTEIDFCPDTAHLVAGGADLIEITKKYLNRIKYVHLKDYSNGTFLPLGKGELPLREMISLLTENGYDGWITVELDYYNGHPKEAASISREFLKSITNK